MKMEKQIELKKGQQVKVFFADDDHVVQGTIVTKVGDTSHPYNPAIFANHSGANRMLATSDFSEFRFPEKSQGWNVSEIYWNESGNCGIALVD
jgi:hypothetical protein